MKRIFALSACIVFALTLLSQETSQSDTLRKYALNVFMESTDFIRKEIPYVNYVRDIKDAGVYIISTRQNTGSGGKEYSYFLIGQKEYAGMRDTLTFVTAPDETHEGKREKEVNTLKMGLMRYVAKTPLSKYMKISFSEPLTETVSTDKWNSWVFRSGVSGYLQGEKTYKSYNALAVKSINDHWSAGGSARLGTSSYSNEEITYSIMPGIEYDVFPYSESTRRQLRILYTVGYTYTNYMDSTIYDKTKENLWSHSISASYEVVQKWGSIDLGVEYSNYFHDWSKNNLSVFGYLDLRIAKGLSVTLVGSAAMVHDQLGLVKEDIPVDQILLQRKELATQFEYFTSFGFTYTFGSIYNNVVNPRFGNAGGGGISISISE